MAVIGGGVIGLAVARRAALDGWSVRVHRTEARGASWVAGGMLAPHSEGWPGEQDQLQVGLDSLALWHDGFLDGLPDDVVTAMQPDPHSAIVALTHDPKLDDMALLEALKSPAFYVGALGSRGNNTARRARLLEYFDLSEAEVGRLHGPVGLPIGSRTPPEIAVSILAEMTAVKNGVPVVRPEATASTPARAGCGLG